MIRLRAEVVITAPLERCFDLARSVDFHAVTARPIGGRAAAGRVSGLSGPGDWTTWSARFFGMRFSLTTEIAGFDRPHGFSDVLRSGPFRHFGHVYTFQSLGPDRTRMTDDFSFQSPCGLLGAWVDAAILRRPMQAVDEARAQDIRRIAESEEWRAYLPQENTR